VEIIFCAVCVIIDIPQTFKLLIKIGRHFDKTLGAPCLPTLLRIAVRRNFIKEHDHPDSAGTIAWQIFVQNNLVMRVYRFVSIAVTIVKSPLVLILL